jgi:hypothetical protein
MRLLQRDRITLWTKPLPSRLTELINLPIPAAARWATFTLCRNPLALCPTTTAVRGLWSEETSRSIAIIWRPRAAGHDTIWIWNRRAKSKGVDERQRT